jgi:hypothetical protein
VSRRAESKRKLEDGELIPSFAHRFMFFCTLWYQDFMGLSPVLATVRFLPSPVTGLILNVRSRLLSCIAHLISTFSF